VKAWKRKFQQTYQSLDIKPFGKWKRAIEGSVRMDAKKEIRKQQEEAIDTLVAESERLGLYEWSKKDESFD
jgi:hypothetical protein